MYEGIIRVEVDEAPVLVLLQCPAHLRQPLGRRTILLEVIVDLTVLLRVESESTLQIGDGERCEMCRLKYDISANIVFGNDIGHRSELLHSN